jgi:hypothetical protein
MSPDFLHVGLSARAAEQSTFIGEDPSTNRGGIIVCQFRNKHFFYRARPHKDLRQDILNVRRSLKAAEKAARRKKAIYG